MYHKLYFSKKNLFKVAKMIVWVFDSFKKVLNVLKIQEFQ